MSAKKTILVLDDDPSVRHMVEVILRKEGFSVIAVADARSALSQCEVQLPDLMIVDLMLPLEDGESFIREFRLRWRRSGVPVVLLSASAARSEIAARLEVAATLPKPFFAEDLREVLASQLGGAGPIVSS